MSNPGAFSHSGTGREKASSQAAEVASSNAAGIYQRIRVEIGKSVAGMEEVVEQVVIGVLTEGHCLLIGVPGLAKTLLIRSLARLFSLSFRRIQFTPDLMPGDITGTEILVEQTGTGERGFHFRKGPLFAHIILADEINRTPPKTQAALLEAMEEGQVTSGGKRHELERPFFVLATQNPIEQEGTYPLPVSQMDRFMFNILVNYPTMSDEHRIIRMTTTTYESHLAALFSREETLKMIREVRGKPVPDDVMRYALALVRRSRPGEPSSPPFVREWVAWGPGPRAVQFLIIGAKARAVIHGRETPRIEDIRALAHPILRHRILVNYQGEVEGISSDEIVSRLLNVVPWEGKGSEKENFSLWRRLVNKLAWGSD